MLLPRIIPVLLLSGKGLVKGIQFQNHVYIGDPVNAVQIFNTKEVDEILFLDILATRENRIMSPDYIQQIANQCLVPFGVGGGIRTLEDAHAILSSGAEKVCLNTAAMHNPKLIGEIANRFGRQSVVVSLDVRRTRSGTYEAYASCGTQRVSTDAVQLAKQLESAGAGEILVNSIDRDGTGSGYDLEILRQVRDIVHIPVIGSGGAGTLDHLKQGLQEGRASAAAAGSQFVLHGKRRAVLISFPSKEELITIRGGP